MEKSISPLALKPPPPSLISRHLTLYYALNIAVRCAEGPHDIECLLLAYMLLTDGLNEHGGFKLVKVLNEFDPIPQTPALPPSAKQKGAGNALLLLNTRQPFVILYTRKLIGRIQNEQAPKVNKI